MMNIIIKLQNLPITLMKYDTPLSIILDIFYTKCDAISNLGTLRILLCRVIDNKDISLSIL